MGLSVFDYYVGENPPDYHRIFFSAALVITTGILLPEKVVEAIDWNTIGLLTGMMNLVGVTRETGLFEFLAIKSARLAKGELIFIMAALSGLTAFISAFLDNVTTVLLIVPVTFAIARRLGGTFKGERGNIEKCVE